MPLRRLLSALLVTALAVGAWGQAMWLNAPPGLWPAKPEPAPHKPSLVDWFEREVSGRIEVTGQRRLGYRAYTVEGDREAFASLSPFGQGDRRFVDLGQMNVVGRNVLGILNFEASFTDSSFRDPQGQRLSLDVRRGPWLVNAGDIQGALLNTNPFAPYSNSLRGVQVGYSSGRFAARALRSETRASSKTVTFQGANTTGPYYLNASQIIRDSVRVRVDGEEVRLGTDYVVDYEFGAITFIDRIVVPTSTVVVTFESLNFNTRPGIIEGAGLTYDFGKAGRFGVTHLRQRGRGGSGLSERVERFQGFGPPSTPYVLLFEPLPGRPVTIRVDGVIQTPGLDYRFDSVQPTIFFMNRFVPSTSTVEVRYTPRPTSILDGDREVTGVDWRIPLGPGENRWIQLSQATGQLSNSATPLRGTARGVEGRYSIEGLDLSGRFVDIPDGYTTVESRGFNRNERSLSLAAEMRRGRWSYGGSHQNASVSARQTDNTGETRFLPARSVQSRAFVGFRPGENGGWQVEHVRSFGRFLSDPTTIDTTSFSTRSNYLGNKLSTTFGIDFQQGRGPINREGQVRTGRLDLQTARTTLSYQPSQEWTYTARAGLSRVRALGDSGTGADYGLSVGYRPVNGRLSIDASYRVSDSGQLSTLGSLDGGFGLGFDGNGFSGGPVGGPVTSFGSDFRLAQITASWRATQRLNFDLSLYQSRSTGAITSNSETVGATFNILADLGRGHNAAVGISNTDTRFLEGGNRSQATNFSALIEATPPGPWSYGAGFTTVLTPSGGLFAQNSRTLDAYLRYRLNRDQNLRLSFSGRRSTGYLPQEEWNVVAAYEYRLFRNIGLVASYNLRRLTPLDGTDIGRYRARGLELELTFDFRP